MAENDSNSPKDDNDSISPERGQVADRIAMFAKKKSASQPLPKQPIQLVSNNNSNTIQRQAVPSPEEKVNILDRISMFKKDLEQVSNHTHQKEIHIDNHLSISERISNLKKEQQANSYVPTQIRAVPQTDGFVSDRIAQLMKEAEKSSATNLIHSSTRLATGQSPPPLMKPGLEITPASERESKNKLQILLDRLSNKDSTLTVLEFNNSNLLALKDENFDLFATVLKDNPYIVDMELCNVMMKDKHCFILMEALKTCPNLVILNIETNMLSGAGIETVASMVEHHPNIKELRIDNQRMSVGIDAERAIANCLSQNTNIIKLSYTFREMFVFTYVNKYLQRNLDLIRQERCGKGIHLEPTPYPYPLIQGEADAAFRTPESKDKTAGTIFDDDANMTVNERVLALRQDTRISGNPTSTTPTWHKPRTPLRDNHDEENNTFIPPFPPSEETITSTTHESSTDAVHVNNILDNIPNENNENNNNNTNDKDPNNPIYESPLVGDSDDLVNISTSFHHHHDQDPMNDSFASNTDSTPVDSISSSSSSAAAGVDVVSDVVVDH